MRFLGLSLVSTIMLSGWLAVTGLAAASSHPQAPDPLPRRSAPYRPPQLIPEAATSGSQEAPDMVETPAEPDASIQQAEVQPDTHAIRLAMDGQYASQLTDTDRPNTCGPTSLFMVLNYFELGESLDTVINRHEYPAEQGGYDPQCAANPVCTSPGALARVAREDYGLTVNDREGWTFEELRGSLAEGHPVIADIVWGLADEGPGHFVVIYGINTELRTITYHDPYDGAAKEANWDEFTVAWDGPVDRGDPLQPEGHRFWAMEIGID